MPFHLATTMYEQYYQREPVNFFIMFIYLPTTTYACYWPSAAVYIFSLCASSQPQSCMNALPWWFGLFFLLCFQLATTTLECYFPRGPYYIFRMCFQLATTMYEHSCPRCPVYFFLIMCCYLGKTMYEHYFPIGGV